jgi:hypothetical protein
VPCQYQSYINSCSLPPPTLIISSSSSRGYQTRLAELLGHCSKESDLIIFSCLSPSVFQDRISSRKKSHDDGRNDTPSEGEFVFTIQTNPAVKFLVYLVGAVSAQDLADKAVRKEKAYTPDVFWFQLAPSGIVG